MTTFTLYEVSDKTRGMLKRYLYELKPGCYVGSITKTQRDEITKFILKNNRNADMVIAYDYNGQVAFETHGDPTRTMTYFDGVPLITRKIKPNLLNYIYAKPDKLLITHMLEAGQTAWELLSSSIYSGWFKQLLKQLNKEENDVKNTICFLIAAHDIGKAHPCFQFYNMPNAGNELLKSSGYDCEFDLQSFRHEQYSAIILQEYLKPFINSKNPAFIKLNIQNYTDIVRYHHQAKTANNYSDITNYKNENEWKKDIIWPMMDIIQKNFPFTDLQIDVCKCADIFSHYVLGLEIVCDRTASTTNFETNMSYGFNADAVSRIINKQLDLENIKALDGVLPLKIQTIMPEKASPRPLQELIETELNARPDFRLILIEDVMGGGKTEAGFFAAYKALENTGLQGIKFTLPTNATSEAMIGRVRTLLKKSGINRDVSLSTGNAWMSDNSGNTSESEKLFLLTGTKIMSNFSVGTIDQVLRAVTSSRFHDVPLSVMANTVLVIDEFHAYDAYMMGEIRRLLEWLNEYGCPVIIMSATLTDSIKRDLFKVYGIDTSRENISPAYPLVTIINDKLIEHSVHTDYHKEIPVKIENCFMDNDKIAELALDEIKEGGNLCVCINTAQRAVNVYNAIKQIADDDVELMLFHARTSQKYKEEKGKRILEKYGKDGKKEGKRPKKSIVVATSIIAESLDIDFDYMISEIMPVDRLLQLLGRKCRHDDAMTIREKPWYKNRIIVLMPESENKLSSKITNPYHEGIFASSMNVIKKTNTIVLPDDMRNMINEAYDNAGQEWSECARIESFLSESTIINPPNKRKFTHDVQAEKIQEVATRYQKYESRQVILLPDDNLSMDNRNISEIIRESMVNIPAYVIPEEILSNENCRGEFGQIFISKSMADKHQICIDEEYGFMIGDDE